jgi:hypothetical protein
MRIDENAIRSWETEYPHLTNTGIRTARTPVVDIDIIDETAVKAVLRLFGHGQRILYRTGRAPKIAIPCRTSDPYPKKIHQYRAPDGSEHKIEILGDGQQMAAFGIHPDTRQPFRWHPESIADVDRADLPQMWERTAERVLDQCDDVLRRMGWEYLRPKNRERSLHESSFPSQPGEASHVAAALGGHRKGQGWMCHCPGPSHTNGDRNPSLAVDEGADGKLLLHCFGGCAFEDVISALRARGVGAPTNG